MSELPVRARGYVLAVEGLFVAGLVALAVVTPWHPRDAATAAAFLACGVVGVETVRRVGSPHKGSNRQYQDLLGAFLIPAILVLPPLYAGLTGLVVKGLEQTRITRLPPVKRLFNVAMNGLLCMGAGLAYGLLADPLSRVGVHTLSSAAGFGALLAAAAVYAFLNQALVAGVLRCVAPATPWRTLVGSRESWLFAGTEICAGILLTIGWLVSPAFILVAAAPVLLLQQVAVHAHLVEAARTDAKTHVATPGFWRDQAQHKAARARTAQRPIALLVIDLDRFKAVNDRYGHLVGDAVLSAVGDTLINSVRAEDVVGRFGGEEFVAILEDADAETALTTAERLRARIAAIRHRLSSGEVGVTASIGLAVLGPDGLELDELLTCADQAMYEAKRAGGDRVVCTRSRPAEASEAREPREPREPAADAAATLA